MPHDSVLDRIEQSYLSQMRDLPTTKTRFVFKTELNLSINGEAFSNKLNLLSAVDNSGNHLIMKVLNLKSDPSPCDIRLLELLSREIRAVR